MLPLTKKSILRKKIGKKKQKFEILDLGQAFISINPLLISLIINYEELIF